MAVGAERAGEQGHPTKVTYTQGRTLHRSHTLRQNSSSASQVGSGSQRLRTD